MRYFLCQLFPWLFCLAFFLNTLIDREAGKQWREVPLETGYDSILLHLPRLR